MFEMFFALTFYNYSSLFYAYAKANGLQAYKCICNYQDKVYPQSMNFEKPNKKTLVYIFCCSSKKMWI